MCVFLIYPTFVGSECNKVIVIVIILILVIARLLTVLMGSGSSRAWSVRSRDSAAKVTRADHRPLAAEK